MKKVMLSLSLVAAMVVSLAGGVSAAGAVSVNVDSKPVVFPDGQPYVDSNSGRTMVPVRFVSESLGATVDWDGVNRTVKMARSGKVITLKAGQKQALVNGKTIQFDASATIKEGRTFVPLRFVSEAYGAVVAWNPDKQLVEISTKAPTVKDDAGKNHPVQESEKYFQAFHNSLVIKNGVISGIVPKPSQKGIFVQFQMSLKDDRIVKIIQNGGTFSYNVNEVSNFELIVRDTKGTGKRLSGYSYLNFPSLVPTKVVD